MLSWWTNAYLTSPNFCPLNVAQTSLLVPYKLDEHIFSCLNMLNCLHRTVNVRDYSVIKVIRDNYWSIWNGLHDTILENKLIVFLLLKFHIQYFFITRVQTVLNIVFLSFLVSAEKFLVSKSISICFVSHVLYCDLAIINNLCTS